MGERVTVALAAHAAVGRLTRKGNDDAEFHSYREEHAGQGRRRRGGEALTPPYKRMLRKPKAAILVASSTRSITRIG